MLFARFWQPIVRGLEPSTKCSNAINTEWRRRRRGTGIVLVKRMYKDFAVYMNAFNVTLT